LSRAEGKQRGSVSDRLKASLVVLAVLAMGALGCGTSDGGDALQATCGDLSDSLDGDGDQFRAWVSAVADEVNSSQVDHDRVAKNAGYIFALSCGISKSDDFRPADGVISQLKRTEGVLFPQ
jgi:hypothetical protein